MYAAVASLLPKSTNIPSTSATMTTLYDLVAAIHDEIDAHEDELVTATVMHLLSSGRIKFLGDQEELKMACA
jgi:hypothetical protein